MFSQGRDMKGKTLVKWRVLNPYRCKMMLYFAIFKTTLKNFQLCRLRRTYICYLYLRTVHQVYFLPFGRRVYQPTVLKIIFVVARPLSHVLQIILETLYLSDCYHCTNINLYILAPFLKLLGFKKKTFILWRASNIVFVNTPLGVWFRETIYARSCHLNHRPLLYYDIEKSEMSTTAIYHQKRCIFSSLQVHFHASLRDPERLKYEKQYRVRYISFIGGGF